MTASRLSATWSDDLGRLMAYRPESDDALRKRTEVEHEVRGRRALRVAGLFALGTALIGAMGGYAWMSGAEDLMNLSILVGLITTALSLRALLDCQPEPRTKACWLCRPIEREVAAAHVPGMLEDPEIGPIVDRWIESIGSLRHVEIDLLLEVYPRWKGRITDLELAPA